MKYKFDKSVSSGRKFKRTSSPLFFVIMSIFVIHLVIFKYWLAHSKYPKREDQEELFRIKSAYLKEVEIDEDFIDNKYLLDVCRCQGIELAPPCAIVGGILGQEILKVISQNEVPLNNFFCHDAFEATGLLMKIV